MKLAVMVSLATLAAATGAPAGPAADRRPAAGTAACGGVEQSDARGWHYPTPPPLVIGDSTMLLSMPSLSRDGFTVNAHGCRQYPEAVTMLDGLRHAGRLPSLVVIALGANGEVHDSDIARVLAILGPRRLLVLVTPRELGGGSGADARLVHAERARHPRRVIVLDWVKDGAAHPQWFEGDGLHLNPAGAAGLGRLVDQVWPLAAPPRSLPTPRCQGPAPMAGGGALTGVLPARPGAGISVGGDHEIAVSFANANPFPVSGIARVRVAEGVPSVIAVGCFHIGAAGEARLELKLTRAAAVRLALLGPIRVRTVLSVSGPEGQRGTAQVRVLLRGAGPRTSVAGGGAPA